jgi:prevent-host-death family protein
MNTSLEQAQSELLDLIRAAQEGEEVVITDHGQVIAKLIGVHQPNPPSGMRAWLARLARLRESTATDKTEPTSEEILEDLRSERG